jgi:hypothetical protein
LQLSVREQATKCLLCSIDLSAEASRIVIFQEIISKLHLSSSVLLQTQQQQLPVLDAAEAESLLDALGRISTRLPIIFLLKHWQMIFPTIERYIVHLASTVRQNSSKVVGSLAKLCLMEYKNSSSSDSPSIVLFQQMLLSFSRSTTTNSTNSTNSTYSTSTNRTCIIQEEQMVWQQMEGRMLSIEVLLKTLGMDFVSKLDTKLLTSSLKNKNFHKEQCMTTSMMTSTSNSNSNSNSNSRSSNRRSKSDTFRYFWANDQALHATWLIDSIEEKEENYPTCPTCPTSSSNSVVLVQSLQAFLFKEKVLKRFFHLTFQCFQSSQFEVLCELVT